MTLAQKTNRLLNKFGYHVKPVNEVFGSQRNEIFKKLGVDLVIDVGANTGQYGQEIRKYGYRSRIYSFEPLPAPFADLKSAASLDGKWTAANAALGDSAGKLKINVSANTQSSSFLPILDSCLRADPESGYVSTLEVPVSRLDDLWVKCAAQSTTPALKMDTQGYEKSILLGAHTVLDKIQLIECDSPSSRSMTVNP